MNKKNLKKPFLTVFMIYLLCYALHIAEYFLLRTDQTLIGEAVIHKILGIVILAVFAKKFGFSAKEIGFKTGKDFGCILKGLGFGAAVFILAYTAEIMIAVSQGSFKSLQLYVSAYAIDKNIGNRTELIFFVICIIGNVLPVPFILLLLKKVLGLLKKTRLHGIAEWVEKRGEKKSVGMKYGEFWGLLLFVGIPLPGTGAWTGSLIATILDMDWKKAIVPILLGVLMATVIMTVFSYAFLANVVG